MTPFMKPPQAFAPEYITLPEIKRKGLLNYSLYVLCEQSSTAKTTQSKHFQLPPHPLIVTNG